MFSEVTEEELQRFVEEENAMVREHTPAENASGEPAPAESADDLLAEILDEPTAAPAPTDSGKEDDGNE